MKSARIYFLCLTAVIVAGAGQAAVFKDNWKSVLSVQTLQDARTDDDSNPSGNPDTWIIDPGADDYSKEMYERPTASMDEIRGGVPASKKYYAYLDIKTGDFALDTVEKVAYYSINLVGPYEQDDGGQSVVGFKDFYRVRFAGNENHRSGYMVSSKDPDGNATGSFNSGGNASYKASELFMDENCPAGGGAGCVTNTGLTNTNEGTLGYDSQCSEGTCDDVRTRVTGDSVQFAIAYEELGISEDTFTHTIWEATKGLTDVQNYFWNDEYSLGEAGSPYDPSNPPDGNIYELDTLVGTVPEIDAASGLGSLAALGAVLAFLRGRRRVPARA